MLVCKILFAMFRLYSDNLLQARRLSERPEEDYQSIIEMLQIKFCQLLCIAQDLLPNIVLVITSFKEQEITDFCINLETKD